MPVRPFNKPKVTDFLAKAIDLSGKSQREVALEAGYEKPNILSMMKLGQTKVPIDKAPAIARACGVDPVLFARLVMQEYWPEVWGTIRDHLGGVLTDEERQILDIFREEAEAAGGRIDLDPDRQRRLRDALRDP